MRSRAIFAVVALAAAALAGLGLFFVSSGAETIAVSKLPQITHIHGIAVDARDPSRRFIATHHGFYVATPDGTARLVSDARHDHMGFTPHPSDPSILYSSGHPAGGGNLGFMMSSDGGKSWRQISKGANGPVDFHQMDVSKTDPNVVYGAYGGTQVSRDGGRSWNMVGPAPEGLIDLAVSSRDANTLYAATQRGLLVSKDGGRTWQDAYLLKRPASMVETARDGSLYAFLLGVGLIKTTEPSLAWSTLSKDFGDRVLLHFAIDPSDASKLYATTQHSEILASADGGRSWKVLGSGEAVQSLGSPSR
ncbi:MAG: exo-alpha-sialidase [Pseudomonadota bacterium]